MERKILFICVHNSGRSVMAEAYANKLGHGKILAESAGFEPRPVLPEIVEVMREEGIDVSGHRPRSVFDLYRQGKMYDAVVTVCDDTEESACPIFPGIVLRDHWPFPDPSKVEGRSAEERKAKVRTIREAVKAKVRQWIDSLNAAEKDL
uniref:Arsenate reductase ArsC n=1 Tax=Desulfacinum infernum TaxID=35837 RepID=A0A832A2T9_9BACT